MLDSRSSIFTNGPWFVYILLCSNNSLYTGITKDVQKRFQAHCNGKGAKYTKIHKPLSIIHCEQYENFHLAAKRELEIKALPKIKKIKLNNLK